MDFHEQIKIEILKRLVYYLPHNNQPTITGPDTILIKQPMGNNRQILCLLESIVGNSYKDVRKPIIHMPGKISWNLHNFTINIILDVHVYKAYQETIKCLPPK